MSHARQLEKFKGPKAQNPIREQIQELLDQIKGHEKEIRQKWPKPAMISRCPLEDVLAVLNVFEIEAGLRSVSEKERWAAAEAAGELVASRPQAVWNLVVAHGVSAIEDVRTAIATCMLEHLLEEHFDEYFPLLEREVRSGKLLLGDTLRRCWKMGLAELPENSARWDNIVKFARDSLAALE